MTEILLCNRPYSPESLKTSAGIEVNPLFRYSEAQQKQQALYQLAKGNSICPYTPYPTGATVTDTDRSIAAQLSNPRVAKGLTDFSTAFGAEATIAMATVRKKLEGAGFGGTNIINTSGGLYSGKIDRFIEAVKKYQDSLMDYQKHVKTNADKGIIKAAQVKVNQAFANLQTRFQAEMRVINAKVKPNARGTAMSNPTRATNIARSSRSNHLAKLNVSSQIQASNLVKFGQHAKVLGNGLAAIDFTSRASGVIQTAENGGDWERELFNESLGFAASAYFGGLATSATIGLFLLATPVGWVAVLATVAAVGVGIGVATATNKAVKKLDDRIYDWAITQIASLY